MKRLRLHANRVLNGLLPQFQLPFWRNGRVEIYIGVYGRLDEPKSATCDRIPPGGGEDSQGDSGRGVEKLNPLFLSRFV